jgi:hypothetical protein
VLYAFLSQIEYCFREAFSYMRFLRFSSCLFFVERVNRREWELVRKWVWGLKFNLHIITAAIATKTILYVSNVTKSHFFFFAHEHREKRLNFNPILASWRLWHLA